MNSRVQLLIFQKHVMLPALESEGKNSKGY